jgi:hypothetical protein
MLDVAEAHELLAATLATALAAAQEHTAAQRAVAVEEVALWEQIGAVIVPALTKPALQVAATLLSDERLLRVTEVRDRSLASFEERKRGLLEAVLEDADVKELGARRRLVDERVATERSKLKELRAQRGVLQFLEQQKKGAPLRPDAAALVRSHDELARTVERLEAESARLAAAAARHNKAKNQLEDLAEQIRTVDETHLRDARRLAVEQLLRPDHARPARTDLRPLFHAVDGVAAKRVCLTVLYDSWVRPHGSALLALQGDGNDVTGYETVRFPQRVEVLCRDAAVAVDAFRRSAQGIVGFTAYTSVPHKDGFFAAFAPGIDFSSVLPASAPSTQPTSTPATTPLSAEERASERLAAAYESMALPAAPALNETNVVYSPSAADLAAPDPAAVRAATSKPAASQASTSMSPPASSPTTSPSTAPPRTERTMVAAAPSSAVFTDSADPDPFRARGSTIVTVANVAAVTFAPGDRVGSCVVDALVGRSPWGDVHQGQLLGERLSRPVLIKRLGRVDAIGIGDVVDAVLRAARVAHPNVVRVLDVQETAGEVFAVVDYGEGVFVPNLLKRLKAQGRPLDPRLAVRICLDAARGLDAAHQKRGDDGALLGIVHGAIAPSALFVGQDGFTQVADLGLSRPGDLTTLSGKTELKGKVAYLSPEQVLGLVLDGQSDLFSLGATLYFLLTGKAPFAAPSEVAVLHAIVNTEAPALSLAAFKAAVGPVVHVVEALLRKRPEERPAGARAVIEMLGRCDAASPEELAEFIAQT